MAPGCIPEPLSTFLAQRGQHFFQTHGSSAACSALAIIGRDPKRFSWTQITRVPLRHRPARVIGYGQSGATYGQAMSKSEKIQHLVQRKFAHLEQLDEVPAGCKA